MLGCNSAPGWGRISINSTRQAQAKLETTIKIPYSHSISVPTMLLRRSCLSVGRRLAAKPITPVTPRTFTTSVKRRKPSVLAYPYGAPENLDANCNCHEQEQRETEIQSPASRIGRWFLSKVLDTSSVSHYPPFALGATPKNPSTSTSSLIHMLSLSILSNHNLTASFLPQISEQKKTSYPPAPNLAPSPPTSTNPPASSASKSSVKCKALTSST